MNGVLRRAQLEDRNQDHDDHCKDAGFGNHVRMPAMGDEKDADCERAQQVIYLRVRKPA